MLSKTRNVSAAPKDQRTKLACILCAVRLEQHKSAESILPFCNAEALSLHRADPALAFAPSAHALVPVDRADDICRQAREPPHHWHRCLMLKRELAGSFKRGKEEKPLSAC